MDTSKIWSVDTKGHYHHPGGHGLGGRSIIYRLHRAFYKFLSEVPDPDPSALRSKVPQGVQFDNTPYVNACLSCMKPPASTRTLHLLNCPPPNETRYAQILGTDCVSIRILKVLIPDIEDAHQHLVHICQGSESDYQALKMFWLRSSLCMQQAGTGSGSKPLAVCQGVKFAMSSSLGLCTV